MKDINGSVTSLISIRFVLKMVSGWRLWDKFIWSFACFVGLLCTMYHQKLPYFRLPSSEVMGTYKSFPSNLSTSPVIPGLVIITFYVGYPYTRTLDLIRSYQLIQSFAHNTFHSSIFLLSISQHLYLSLCHQTGSSGIFQPRLPTSQPTNQPINKPTNQPTN